MEKLKIIVVDDNKTFLEGIKFYLEKVLSHNVVGYASNGQEFLRCKDKTIAADVVLMDIQMPEVNGIEAVKKLLWYYRDSKVIAVTEFPGTAALRDYVSAGFKGCVIKSKIFEDLSDAIDNVLLGELYFPDNISIQ